MSRFSDLRERYPIFRYESFAIERRERDWVARFRYSIPPDISFTPEVFFSLPAAEPSVATEPYLNNAIFHLGLIEAFSYWKATASPVIEVAAGALDEQQAQWWEDLLIHGMGEFFYCNDIDFTQKDFVRIVAPNKDGGRVLSAPYRGTLEDRSLVTIGGGRDSALTGALLKDSGLEFRCMMLNPSVAASRVASRVSGTEPVIITRAIAPELLRLNQQGFLNGHTPFSAYLGFLGAACLLIYGYRNVIVSNERSSDEGNVFYHNQEINHQYSKSLRFEARFDEYLRRYVATSARYFSFVRPLYELQIGKLFSQVPEFFDDFRSCNRYQRKNAWCGECPKCVSVFLTMYPFVSRERLTRLFAGDLFEKESTIPILRSLVGMERKPFECVATVTEIQAALSLAVGKLRSRLQALPAVLQYAVENVPGVRTSIPPVDLLQAWGPHRMPAEFERLLKAAFTAADPQVSQDSE